MHCFVTRMSLGKMFLVDPQKLIIKLRVESAKLRIRKKNYINIFTRAAVHIGISNMTGKRFEIVKQSVVFDYELDH